MELQRREHDRLRPEAGDPCQKQEMPERSAAGPLEVLGAVKVKEEMTGGESRLAMVGGVVILSSDSDSNSDSEYDADEELLALGNTRSSMIEGRSQEKLTGKKRTADDMLQEVSQESGNKKLTIKDYKKFGIYSQPDKICEAVALLNEPQREKVKELGFGSLLDFRMERRGPWNFIIWLMDHLETDDQDPDTMVLHFGGNRKLYITQDTVNSVLGLQKGKLDPPSMLTNTYNKLGQLRYMLGLPKRKRIEVNDLLEKIKSGGTDKFTMQCFMMVVFCALMACGTNMYITKKAWRMVNTDFDKFGQMNWCKFIVDQIKYSAKMWKKPGNKRKRVYGCSAFLVMYYLDNLNCEHKMRCVEVPRAKFFSQEMIENLVEADMLHDQHGLPTFGKLTLRNQRGTCYDKRAESSRDATTYMPIPGTSDTHIVATFSSSHNQIQIGDLSSHQSLCPLNKNNAKQQQQLHITQIGEPQERRKENEDGLNGYHNQQTMACNSSELFVHQETDVDIAMATQGTTPPQEAFHGDPKVSAVPQGEHEVTGGSEDSYRHVLVHSFQGPSEDVVQLASISMKEQVNDFMGDSSEPGIVKKLDSPLPQIRASVALGVRTSDLEQQVQELTKKLSNNEEELEGTRSKLRRAQVFQLEAQSAVAAINFLALRLSATFVRLGSDPPSPSSVVSSSSLDEAVKLLDDLVSRTEPVSRNYATSLACSSVGFVAATLLSRDGEKGVKALLDAMGADTRRLVQSQGPEFHSLVAQVVDAVQKQQHGNDAANTRL